MDLKGRKALGFIRWSSDKQTDRDSLPRQTKSIESAVKDTGAELVKTFIAQGESAFDGSHIKVIDELIAYARKNPTQRYVVFIEKVNRLSREQINDAENLWKRLLVDCDIYFTETKDYHDASTLNDIITRITMLIRAEEANKHSEQISKQVQQHHRRKIKNAIETGKACNLGSKPHWLDVVKDEYVENQYAQVVRLIYKLYLEGKGSTQISNYLNINEYKRWDGKPYHETTILDVLKNEAVNGWITSKKIDDDFNSLPKGNTKRIGLRRRSYPVIISDEDYERAAVLRAANNRNAKGKNSNFGRRTGSFVLSGKTKCGACGAAYCVSGKQVRCSNATGASSQCNARSVSKFLFEQVIVNALFSQISESELFRNKEGEDEKIEVLKGRMATLEAEYLMYQERYNQMKDKGRKPPVEFVFEMTDKNDELAEVKEQLSKEQATEKPIDFDEVKLQISEIFKPENVDLRLKVQMVVSVIVDSIKVKRSDKVIFLELVLKNGEKYLVTPTTRKKEGDRFVYYSNVNNLTHRMPLISKGDGKQSIISYE
ncbi:Recombinase [Grimontia celer]|uniref:Recombinase n=1 Tax=Grimontia celer TaxID=1796497 RepID=A0A128EYA4_9GAMM|nr:recombinase family protein [Grimontia celer]CZF78976.1 Recombinase [Grimontia celer]